MLAAKLFRITSPTRIDAGKAEELIGLSTGLWLCGGGLWILGAFSGNNKKFFVMCKTRV